MAWTGSDKRRSGSVRFRQIAGVNQWQSALVMRRLGVSAQCLGGVGRRGRARPPTLSGSDVQLPARPCTDVLLETAVELAVAVSVPPPINSTV